MKIKDVKIGETYKISNKRKSILVYNRHFCTHWYPFDINKKGSIWIDSPFEAAYYKISDLPISNKRVIV